MKIFISYRRADSRWLARTLADHLREADNVDEVFIDVESIAPGQDFKKVMLDALRKSDLCLVLMGDKWAAGERIHDPNDPVRLEVLAALQAASGGSVNLTPVLIDGFAMPGPDELPEDLAPLAYRNATPLRHQSFQADLQGLADKLDITLAAELTTKEIVLRTLAGVAAAFGVFFLASLIHMAVLQRSLETTLGSRAALLAVLVGVLVAGGVIPNYSLLTKRQS